MQRWATIGGIVCLLYVNTVTATTNVAEAVPLQAIPAILDLFKTYQVVGLGEGPHGNLEGTRFASRSFAIRVFRPSSTTSSSRAERLVIKR
jgi:hypothetical protein